MLTLDPNPDTLLDGEHHVLNDLLGLRRVGPGAHDKPFEARRKMVEQSGECLFVTTVAHRQKGRGLIGVRLGF